jgi:hypothetical protein
MEWEMLNNSSFGAGPLGSSRTSRSHRISSSNAHRARAWWASSSRNSSAAPSSRRSRPRCSSSLQTAASRFAPRLALLDFRLCAALPQRVAILSGHRVPDLPEQPRRTFQVQADDLAQQIGRSVAAARRGFGPGRARPAGMQFAPARTPGLVRPGVVAVGDIVRTADGARGADIGASPAAGSQRSSMATSCSCPKRLAQIGRPCPPRGTPPELLWRRWPSGRRRAGAAGLGPVPTGGWRRWRQSRPTPASGSPSGSGRRPFASAASTASWPSAATSARQPSISSTASAISWLTGLSSATRIRPANRDRGAPRRNRAPTDRLGRPA